MHLERWMIDELTDSTATLLRSVYNMAFEMPDVDDLRWVIQGGENAISEEVWGEEKNFVLRRASLSRFPRRAVRRSRRRELPAARPMREGDVYWVVSETPVRRPDDVAGPNRTERFLA